LKINQRGQSALEYLMTYGWALVVIVIVVAALVLLVGNPAQAADTCSGPGAILNITNQEIGASGWNLRVSNISGRTLSAISITSSTAPGTTPDDNGTYTITGSMAPGAIVTVGPSTSSYIASTRYRTDFTVGASDGDFFRTVTFSCTGTA